MTTRRHLLAVTALISFVAGCGDDGNGSPATTPAPTTSSNSTSVASTSTTPSSVPDGDEEAVEATGVVLAAVLLAAGDVEAAVAAGLVSPSEVDQAALAVEAGTMATWIDRAMDEIGP